MTTRSKSLIHRQTNKTVGHPMIKDVFELTDRTEQSLMRQGASEQIEQSLSSPDATGQTEQFLSYPDTSSDCQIFKESFEFGQDDASDQHAANEASRLCQATVLEQQAVDLFHFLKLPAELRNLIYEHCVVADGAIDPYQHTRRLKIAMLCSQKPNLSVLHINKQVSGEAKAVLFGRNRWRLFYEPDVLIATPWNKAELATTFWNTNIQEFRHVVTGFDFLERFEMSGSSTAEDLMCQLVLIWEWKKKLLVQMKLASFRFNLDHYICRDGCRRWDIIKFICRELSLLQENWRTTHVVVTGTRTREERSLVHIEYGFASW